MVREEVKKTRGIYSCSKDGCGFISDRLKDFKKCNSGFYCKKHYAEKMKKHREYLKRDVLGIRTRKQQIKDWEEARKLKESRKKIVSPRLPKIPGSKLNRPSPKISPLGMWLTKDERKVLYFKYINQGMDSREANKKLKESVEFLSVEFLSSLVKKLREKKKTDKQINVIFKEEFAKLGSM